MDILNKISSFLPYFNPFNSSFDSKRSFSALSLANKIVIIFATTVATVVTFGIASVATFRFCTQRLSAAAEKTRSVANKILVPTTPPLSPPLTPLTTPIASPLPPSAQTPQVTPIPLPPPAPSARPLVRKHPFSKQSATLKAVNVPHPFEQDFQRVIQESAIFEELKRLDFHTLIKELIRVNRGLRVPPETRDRLNGAQHLAHLTEIGTARPSPIRRFFSLSTRMNIGATIDITENTESFLASLDRADKSRATTQVREFVEMLCDPENGFIEQLKNLVDDLSGAHKPVFEEESGSRQPVKPSGEINIQQEPFKVVDTTPGTIKKTQSQFKHVRSDEKARPLHFPNPNEEQMQDSIAMQRAQKLPSRENSLEGSDGGTPVIFSP